MVQNGVPNPRKLVTKADFARQNGVTKQAIHNAMKRGLLRDAAVGDRVDLEHPQAQAYLERHRIRRSSDPESENGQPATVATDPAPTSEPLITDDGLDISRYADLTLRELVDRFGSVRALKDWLEALKKIEDIREKRLNNEEVQRSLISRELVKTHVFGFLEAGNRRLLGDTPKTIARRLYGLARSDAPIEEAEGLVREIIGSQLAPQKTRVARLLREE